jgi:DNA-binding MarR family transcriptional regulator
MNNVNEISGDPRWLSDAEREAWKALSLMQLQLTARLGQALSGSGLSYQDYTVLAGLTDDPDGRMRVVEFSRQLGWEKSRVSHHVSRMIERGLVTRESCPTDKRGAFVVITAEGRRAIEAAAPGHVATVRKFFIDLLDESQVEAIQEIADTVLTNLKANCDER